MDQRFAVAAFPTLSAFTVVFDPRIERDLKKKTPFCHTLLVGNEWIHDRMNAFASAVLEQQERWQTVSSAGQERQNRNCRDHVQTDWDGITGGGHQQALRSNRI